MCVCDCYSRHSCMHKCNEISCFYYASLCFPFPALPPSFLPSPPSACLVQHKKSQFNFAPPPASHGCQFKLQHLSQVASLPVQPQELTPFLLFLSPPLSSLHSTWQLVEHCFQGLPSGFKERLSESSTPRSPPDSLRSAWLLIKTSTCVLSNAICSIYRYILWEFQREFPWEFLGFPQNLTWFDLIPLCFGCVTVRLS